MFGFACVVVWVVILLCFIGAMILEFMVPVISWQVFLAESENIVHTVPATIKKIAWIQLSKNFVL